MAYPPTTNDLDNRLLGYSWAANLSATQKSEAIKRGRYLVEIRYPDLDTTTDLDIQNFGWWLVLEIATWYAGLPYVTDSVTGQLPRTWIDVWSSTIAPHLEAVASLSSRGKPLLPQKK